MGKRLLSIIGIVMIAFASPIAAAGERLAFHNPEDAILRSTTIPVARLEGALAVAIARRGRWPTWISIPFAIAGIALVLAPNTTLRGGLWLAYRNSDRIEPRPWVRPATRLVGGCHLLFLLLLARRMRRRS